VLPLGHLLPIDDVLLFLTAFNWLGVNWCIVAVCADVVPGETLSWSKEGKYERQALF